MKLKQVIKIAKQILKDLPEQAKWGQINYSDLEPRQESIIQLIKLAKETLKENK